MVVKASFDVGQLYNEVQILMQIHDFAKDNKEFKETLKSIPERLDHGILYVDKDEMQSFYRMKDKPQPNADVAETDTKQKLCLDKKPLVYYLMPRFGQNLRSVLKQKNFNITDSSKF